MTYALTRTSVGTAELVGTIRQPKLVVRFGYGMTHASTGQNLVDWCKQLPGRRWNPDVNAWEITSLGPNPDAALAAAGFELMTPEEGELAGIVSLEQLYMPVTMLASNQRTVLVRTRFCGYEGTQKLIDNAGVWDKTRELLTMSAVDVIKGASPRPGIHWDPRAIERGHQMHADSPLLAPELGLDVAALANALEPRAVASHIKAIQAHLGGPVGTFGVDLFPYQIVGAYGVAGGHTLLADSPGVGKAQPLTEPVLTPTGFRPMGELTVGDDVIGSDGKPTRVMAVYPQGVRPIYRVRFSDGAEARCDLDHLWHVVDHHTDNQATLTTRQILANGLHLPTHTSPSYGQRYEVPLIHADENTPGAARLQDIVAASCAVPGPGMGGLIMVVESTPKQTAEDVVDLARRLGGCARPAGRGVWLRLPNWLREKAAHPDAWAKPARYIVDISFDGEEDAQCIRVAADDHLYVTRDYVVTHNTFQSLAATAALRADALLIVCPPVVTTNWAREVVKSGVFDEADIVTFRTGRKEPSLDDAKVVVISDSLLSSRPHLIHHLGAWMGRHERVVVAYDEAHRAKTMGSKRSEAVLDMVALASHARRVAITGTPVLAGPHELVPILEFTGHLGPVFGGAGPYLEAYCTRDRFGAFHPRKAALPSLHAKLNAHVWMRRTKADVLPFLPPKHITSVPLDVSLTDYKKSHAALVDEIVEWFQAVHTEHGRWPNEGELEEFAQDNLRYASDLRRAAGMTKVPIAIEMVEDWVKGNPDEPVLVWAHHKDVIAALHETAVKAKVKTGVIAGGISDAERMRLVDGFQAGQIPVLICSITAAGVGITLTRSSNAIFVESDWTPALMLQAMDRQHRIGQTRDVHAEILLALGTLDEHIQGTLAKKGDTLEAILGDNSNSVAVGDDRELMNLKEVMAGLIRDAQKKLRIAA